MDSRSFYLAAGVASMAALAAAFHACRNAKLRGELSLIMQEIAWNQEN